MRPLSIVLAILAAALWISYPDYVVGYALASQSLPDIMFAVQVVLLFLALLTAAIDEWRASEFETELLNSVDAIPGPSGTGSSGNPGLWPGLSPPPGASGSEVRREP